LLPDAFKGIKQIGVLGWGSQVHFVINLKCWIRITRLYLCTSTCIHRLGHLSVILKLLYYICVYMCIVWLNVCVGALIHVESQLINDFFYASVWTAYRLLTNNDTLFILGSCSSSEFKGFSC
jgi:hypothetical protein